MAAVVQPREWIYIRCNLLSTAIAKSDKYSGKYNLANVSQKNPKISKIFLSLLYAHLHLKFFNKTMPQ